MRSAPVMAALLLAACGDFPRDPGGTLERVRAERSFRVGLVAGAPDGAQRTQAFLNGVQSSAGARPAAVTGAAEPLLAALERGALDLVVGPMSAKSPYRKQVHFLPLEAGKAAPPDHLQLVAMARNGENGWIALLHREAEAVKTP